MEAIAETSAPAPALSEETQRLLEVDAHGLDAELLDIYLTEAGEVLDGIGEHLRVLSRATRATARRSRTCGAASTR